MPARRRISAHEKRLVGARQEWACAKCKVLLGATFEVDHVVPLHRGGADHLDNCQALCCACHRSKTLHEEIERLHAIRNVRNAHAARPPLVCMRCGCVVSPYFAHRCIGIKDPHVPR